MRQVLHIFAKDTRRHWLEIVLSLGALGLVGWSDWIMTSPQRSQSWYVDIGPVMLFALCWWSLCVRIIHGEVLVGDRQFWITRPYRWPCLLAAKMLFVVVFFVLPVITMYLVLLKLAGFFSIQHCLWVLQECFEIPVVVIIPAVALAAITKNIGQYLAALVAMIGCVIGIAFLSDKLEPTTVSSVQDKGELLQFACFGICLLVCIVMQYGRRQTGHSIALVCAAVVLIPANMVLFPYKALIERSYPIRTVGASSDFSVVNGYLPAKKDVVEEKVEENVTVAFPLGLYGLPRESVMIVDGAILTLADSKGEVWNSKWQRSIVTRYVMPPGDSARIDIDIPRHVYEQYQQTELKAQLRLAVRVLKDSGVVTVKADRMFRVPGIGQCWTTKERTLSCRTTTEEPKFVRFRVKADETTCPPPEDDRDVRQHGEGDDISSPSDPEPISSLSEVTFSVNPWSHSEHYVGAVVCPGTPVTLSAPTVERQYSVVDDLGSIRLDDYRRGRLY